jgi:glucose/arabinose dehydrogenase
MRSLCTCLVALSVLALPALAAVPAGFQETNYSNSVLIPTTGLAWAPDGSGRLFILNKNGKVLVATMRDGELVKQGSALATTVFATEAVYINSECGLIGLAFDPNFAVNRYVYLFMTAEMSPYAETSSLHSDRRTLCG